MDILTGAGEVVTASPRPSTPTSSAPSRTPMARLATRSGCDRARAGQAVRRAARTCGSTRWPTWSPRWTASSRPAATTARRSTTSTAWCSAPTRATCRSGVQTATPGPVSDYTGQQIYYRSIQHADGAKHDRLTIHDYLWRWDTDWFWCSRAFGAQHPRVRRLWPRRYRRSSFYWKLIALDRRFDIADRLEKRNGRPPRERVVQDVEVPIERRAGVPATGSWPTCRSSRSGCARCGCATTRGLAALPDPSPHRTYVNVGFWSSVPVGPRPTGDDNRLIEREGQRARRAQVAVLRRVLLPRRVRRALRRRDLPDREERVRPRLTTARPLCEGGATTMTHVRRARRRCRRPHRRCSARDAGPASSRSPRSWRSSPAAAAAAVHRLRRQLGRARRRRARPGSEDAARHDLPGHRARRSRSGPRLRRRRPRHPRRAPRRSLRAAQGAGRRAGLQAAAARGCWPTSSARIGFEHLTPDRAAAAGGAAALAAHRRRACGTARPVTPRRSTTTTTSRTRSTSGCSARR